MLDLNNSNTTGSITSFIQNVNQTNIAYNESLLLSTPTSPTFTPPSETNTSILFTDFIVNSTVDVVDYAAQWMATTIATTSNNFTTFNDEANSSISSLIAAINRENCTNPPIVDSFNRTDYDDCDLKNPDFNCSRMDYILFYLGPQTLPLYIIITILYGGIFITGFLGNVLVCVVIVKHTAMHTATNYYLFNLAVSDLIYLIFGLPNEVFSYWHQYPYLFGLPFCKARAYISEASTYASVLTIVAFSVERYLAICHPLHNYALSGFKRALRIIAFLWVASFIGAIPSIIWTKIKYMCYPPDKTEITESGFCVFESPENIPFLEVSSLIIFFIPMCLIFYFYGRMGAKIYSRTTQKLGVQKGSMHRESRHQQSRKAVIRMLTAVVVTFFICWLPFHIQRLWTVHGKLNQYYEDVNDWLFKITGFAYYVTCTINPILYNVMSHRYRVAFKDILCGKRTNAYLNNGFSREQSSFRETVATSLYNSTYDRMHSVRVRSVRIVNNVKDRSSINSNNISWKKSDFNMPKDKNIPENHIKNFSGTNAVVVCVDNGVNGRTKVFTENEAEETLLNKNNETCI